MVHQGDAIEADGICCECEVSEPVTGIRIPPGKPRDLEHHSWQPTWCMIMIDSGHVELSVRGTVLIDDHDVVPALILGRLEGLLIFRSCSVRTAAGTGRSRSRLRSRRCGRRVHDHEHCGKFCGTRESQVVSPPLQIQAEGVDHRRSTSAWSVPR